MSMDPDSSDADDVATADTAFGELLAEVARGPQASLLPAGTVVGEYKVVKQLGRGAFGAVYHATHTVIGKQVALKVLNAQFSQDAAMAARFVDEARAVNRIAHPNIVDIFGFGMLPDGRKYCVMELLSGETLAACLERRGHLALAEAVEILAQVASALDAAHAASVVHRDLKPDNIFLCQSPHPAADGRGAVKVKLLDFGIAQMADGLHMRTGSNMVLGTPGYMSPEQCRGARIDARSDIYALGVVAFELLTGSLPFRGTNAFQVTAQHLTAEPPAPSERLPGLSSQVDAAVLAMLAKSPAERPPSAALAVRALAGGVSLPPPSSQAVPAASGRLAAGSSPSRWLWAAPLLLALLGSLGMMSRRWFSPASAPAAAESQAVPAAAAAESQAVPAAAAATASPSSSAPVPAPVPAATHVTLRITGHPAAARVFLGSEELGKLDEPLSLPRSNDALTLTVKAPGFVPRVMSVTPTRDQAIEVRLSPAPRPRKSDLEY